MGRHCLIWIVVILFSMGFGGCGMVNPPATVERVDLGRYGGKWYEIARVPQWFEMGCAGVTAEYRGRADGKIDVINTCHQGSPTGPAKGVVGTARVVDAATNAKLKVMFQWPFEGDYWILRLNDDYTTAVVGSPDRQYLWILHRTPTIGGDEYEKLVESLRADGLPVDKLHFTQQ